MQINISGEAEALLKRNAALAGFEDDVEQYVLSLILEDEPEPPVAMPAANDPRIIQAIDEGFASGDAGEITPEFWEERRRKLEQVIAQRQKSS